MNWISILGDSICTFEEYNAPGYYIYYNDEIQKENGISSVSDMWWYKVISYLNGELCVNNSCAGSMVTGDELISATNDRRIKDLSTKAHTPDIILVAMGFNDYGFGKDIADFEAAYTIMLDKLTVRYPEAEIICGTLAESFVGKRSTSLFPLTPGNNKLSQFNEVIRIVCKSRGIRLADIAGRERYETLDGVHPTVVGHTTIANLWIDCLKSEGLSPLLSYSSLYCCVEKQEA